MSRCAPATLLNPFAENHCFVNVGLQILWHLPEFREAIATLKRHVCYAEECLVCALQELFQAMAVAGEGNPKRIRMLLAKLDPARFGIQEPGDAEEAFRAMLEILHCHNPGVSDAWTQSLMQSNKALDPLNTMCAPVCLSHTVFWMNTLDVVTCAACDYETFNPSHVCSFGIDVSVANILQQLQSRPASSRRFLPSSTPSPEELWRDALAGGTTLTLPHGGKSELGKCPNSKCPSHRRSPPTAASCHSSYSPYRYRYPYATAPPPARAASPLKVQHLITEPPSVLLVNFHWQPPSLQALKQEFLQQPGNQAHPFCGLTRGQWMELSLADQAEWKRNQEEQQDEKAEEWAKAQSNKVLQDQIQAVLDKAVPARLNLAAVFPSSKKAPTPRPYALCGIVCFGAGHYQAFFLYASASGREQWWRVDDATAAPVASASEVARRIIQGRLLPTMLLYRRGTGAALSSKPPLHEQQPWRRSYAALAKALRPRDVVRLQGDPALLRGALGRGSEETGATPQSQTSTHPDTRAAMPEQEVTDGKSHAREGGQEMKEADLLDLQGKEEPSPRASSAGTRLPHASPSNPASASTASPLPAHTPSMDVQASPQGSDSLLSFARAPAAPNRASGEDRASLEVPSSREPSPFESGASQYQPKPLSPRRSPDLLGIKEGRTPSAREPPAAYSSAAPQGTEEPLRLDFSDFRRKYGLPLRDDVSSGIPSARVPELRSVWTSRAGGSEAAPTREPPSYSSRPSYPSSAYSVPTSPVHSTPPSSNYPLSSRLAGSSYASRDCSTSRYGSGTYTPGSSSTGGYSSARLPHPPTALRSQLRGQGTDPYHTRSHSGAGSQYSALSYRELEPWAPLSSSLYPSSATSGSRRRASSPYSSRTPSFMKPTIASTSKTYSPTGWRP